MEEKTFCTRFDEVTIRVSDPKQMVGKFLAANVLRTWTEDFTDQDTGEKVTVERNEIVVDGHRILNDEDVAKIMFHIQCGDVEDVLVSNQERSGEVVTDRSGAYTASIKEGKESRTVYLDSAFSIGMAYQIVADYAEQAFKTMIQIKSIKEFDATMIHHTRKYSKLDNAQYFQVSIQIIDDWGESKVKYVCLAKDTDEATAIAMAYAKSKGLETSTYTPIEVKQTPITDVVPKEMCQAYIQHAKNEAWIMDGVRVGQHEV